VSISSKLGSFVLAVVVVAALTGCGAPSTCLRYSDCAQGLTCAAGKCVIPGFNDDNADGQDESAVESVVDAGESECTSGDNNPCGLTSSNGPETGTDATAE